MMLLCSMMALSLVACAGVETDEISTENGSMKTQQEDGLKECQVLSDSDWIEVQAYDMDVQGFQYQRFVIPKICQWDETTNAFIALDNETNVNGESVIINAKTVEIDENNADYTTGIVNVQSDLEANKEGYKSYGIESSDEDEVYSYYYVTEDIETINEKEMVHTKGYFELAIYNRPYSQSTYIRLIFEVDIVKPQELTENSVDEYIEDLYESITDGWVYSLK